MADSRSEIDLAFTGANRRLPPTSTRSAAPLELRGSARTSAVGMMSASTCAGAVRSDSARRRYASRIATGARARRCAREIAAGRGRTKNTRPRRAWIRRVRVESAAELRGPTVAAAIRRAPSPRRPRAGSRAAAQHQRGSNGSDHPNTSRRDSARVSPREHRRWVWESRCEECRATGDGRPRREGAVAITNAMKMPSVYAVCTERALLRLRHGARACFRLRLFDGDDRARSRPVPLLREDGTPGDEARSRTSIANSRSPLEGRSASASTDARMMRCSARAAWFYAKRWPGGRGRRFRRGTEHDDVSSPTARGGVGLYTACARLYIAQIFGNAADPPRAEMPFHPGGSRASLSRMSSCVSTQIPPPSASRWP